MAKTMINRSRRRLVFQLAHPAFMKKRWGYQLMTVRTHDHNPRTGAVGIREQRKGLGGSLSLCAGEKLVDLPDAIAAVPDVARAVKLGLVQLRDTTADELKGVEAAKAEARAKAGMPSAAPAAKAPAAKASKAKAAEGGDER